MQEVNRLLATIAALRSVLEARVHTRAALVLLSSVVLGACKDGRAAQPTPVASVSAGAAAFEPRIAPEVLPPRSAEELRALLNELSEPGGEFFEDNYVSNETSYLQVVPGLLERVQPGGVYLGVGPEQGFTYIALTRPSEAFIVDIRRDNLLLHLLYKVAFDLAGSRAEFLALLIGRRFEPSPPLPAAAPLDQVFARAEQVPADRAEFKRVHTRVGERIALDRKSVV